MYYSYELKYSTLESFNEAVMISKEETISQKLIQEAIAFAAYISGADEKNIAIISIRKRPYNDGELTYEAGDKFIIELETSFESDGYKQWKVKGTNTLYVTEAQLNKLMLMPACGGSTK